MMLDHYLRVITLQYVRSQRADSSYSSTTLRLAGFWTLCFF